jgi:hypothetical protein
MADPPKDKKAAALERIKALKEGRAANRTGNPRSGAGGEDSSAPRNAPKQDSSGHRPQGG